MTTKAQSLVLLLLLALVCGGSELAPPGFDLSLMSDACFDSPEEVPIDVIYFVDASLAADPDDLKARFPALQGDVRYAGQIINPVGVECAENGNDGGSVVKGGLAVEVDFCVKPFGEPTATNPTDVINSNLTWTGPTSSDNDDEKVAPNPYSAFQALSTVQFRPNSVRILIVYTKEEFSYYWDPFACPTTLRDARPFFVPDCFSRAAGFLTDAEQVLLANHIFGIVLLNPSNPAAEPSATWAFAARVLEYPSPRMPLPEDCVKGIEDRVEVLRAAAVCGNDGKRPSFRQCIDSPSAIYYDTVYAVDPTYAADLAAVMEKFDFGADDGARTMEAMLTINARVPCDGGDDHLDLGALEEEHCARLRTKGSKIYETAYRAASVLDKVYELAAEPLYCDHMPANDVAFGLMALAELYPPTKEPDEGYSRVLVLYTDYPHTGLVHIDDDELTCSEQMFAAGGRKPAVSYYTRNCLTTMPPSAADTKRVLEQAGFKMILIAGRRMSPLGRESWSGLADVIIDHEDAHESLADHIIKFHDEVYATCACK